MNLSKIISGGQTGADRGGLEAAIQLGLEHGGWCPRGRKAEDAGVPNRYRLQETPQKYYPDRTKRNVLESDGTLIFATLPLSAGSELTERLCRQNVKPCLVIHVGPDDVENAQSMSTFAQQAHEFVESKGIKVLNVAGSRESKLPGIYQTVFQTLMRAFAKV